MSQYLMPAALAGVLFIMPAEAKERYDATIVCASYGIPHITAQGLCGAGYGVGYAYAQDNLCMIAEEFATVARERSMHLGAEAKAVVGFAPVDNLSSDPPTRGNSRSNRSRGPRCRWIDGCCRTLLGRRGNFPRSRRMTWPYSGKSQYPLPRPL
ncbi:hypothetical protein SKP52_11300 [Sphingopyxis fribergensis]|uniref:Uncharacterized protein n=1 Tax=Sphingopyxis fribergensis TaxID=1515612 RepID=A0A0A7PGQ3_9SPHN|nr:penicillin acylase family protein [Sphingopyxis fribergensis]AJA09160.1 hypothetical protein SKP52_11300 [Sphingopyxis fribergensis]